jgi:hypothetical protein
MAYWFVSRQFWTWTTIQSVVGAFVSMAAVVFSLTIDDRLVGEIDELDGIIAFADKTNGEITRATFQYDLFNTTGTMIRFSVFNPGIPPELRENIQQLGLLNKRRAMRDVLSILHRDADAYLAVSKDYDAVFEPAMTGGVKERQTLLDWEFARLADVLKHQGDIINGGAEARSAKASLERKRGQYALASTLVQQLGLVIVLLAGLAAEHGPRRED